MIINYNNKTRAIKTIKTRMYRYMTLKQFQRDIDRLQEFAQSYNKTYHRSIATKPELVNPYNEREVRVSTFRSREEIPRKQKKATVQVQNGGIKYEDPFLIENTMTSGQVKCLLYVVV